VHKPVSGLCALLGLYRGHYLRLTLALLVYVLKASPSWALPIVAASVVDVAATHDAGRMRTLWWDGIVLAVLLLQNIPSNWLYLRLLSRAIRGVEAGVRAAVAEQVQRLSMGVFTRTSSGALQSKLVRDVEIVGQASQEVLQDVPAVALTLLVALGVTAARAPVFLLVLLPAMSLALLCARWSHRSLATAQHDHRRSAEETASALASMLRMLPVTRAHGGEEQELRRLRHRLDEHRELGRRLDASTGWFTATSWVAVQACGSMCLIAAGWAALNNRFGIDVGDVVLLSGYFGTLTGGVLNLLNQLPVIQRGLESVVSLHEVLHHRDVEDNDGKPALQVTSGRIQLDHVSFRYAGGPAIEDLNLTIEAGELLAVVGRSGAGKSTLLNLLLGFLHPSTGRILVDGADLREVDLRSFRRHVATVPQDVVLKEGTLRDNLLHGLGSVSDDRLREAVLAAGVAEFADELPSGLETEVGEGGLRLAGGQRQRVAIARALVRDARILLLDEATSALDGPSELLVQAGLGRLVPGRTCIVVAHRLSTIRRADRILVLARGRVVGLGTHQQLAVDCPEYQTLIRAAVSEPA
jgi:ATP-binding cassette subfamily B protein